ncbi:MAG TPA: methyltransferase, partial [Polyangiaceae bacterium]|nr:methyltransferase [Polyangiaceae bacterium]
FHQQLGNDGETWAAYQRAMLELARLDASSVARRVPVRRGARRLIDLGGGHGLFGAAICRAHPPLQSTVFELPGALPEARRLAEMEGLAPWVTHRAADLSTCDFEAGVDVALLCNVLHHFEREARASLLERVFAALSPGATIAIWEPEAPAPGAPPELAGDAVALYFRVTSSAPPVSAAALCEELKRAGFVASKVHRPLRARGRMLLHARKAPL